MSALIKAIASRGQEWSFDTHLDFGVLGEKQVEVFYLHFYENKSNDPFQIPEPEYCEVTSVIWDGKDIKSSLNEDLIEDLAIDALENWNGK